MIWQTVSEVFEHAVALSSGPEREAYLSRLAEDHPDELAEVRALLAEEADLHPLLQAETVNLWDTIYDLAWEGRTIGPYRLVRHLASGGMGAVLLAERADGQFEQTVALKLIRPGRWSERLAAHFRSERQILARLQHPNIARLLDGGMTDEEQPYFTMEYVEGEPLTNYCRDHRLLLPDRLRLYRQAVQAVAYAHQNLIVHLDLKPSNILVNGEGQVKLLDFGIAQVLQEQRAPGPGFFTEAYASPEQARGEALTTASDLYSLGVLLLDLLGRPLPTEPADRQSETVDLKPPSDLLAIAQKAARPQPDERYATAGDLAADLDRFLTDRPVEAYRASRLYPLRQWLRRHHVTAAATGVALVLLAATVSFYTLRLQQQRDVARLEAEKASQVAEFLTSIFQSADPNVEPNQVTAAELLARGTAGLADNLGDQPLLLADLYDVVAHAYHGLGILDRADSLSQLGLAIKRQHLPEPHDDLLHSLASAGDLALLTDLERADSLLHEAYAMALILHGPGSAEVADQQYLLASLAYQWSDFEKADSLFGLVVPDYERRHEPNGPEMADLWHVAGTTKRKLGQYDTAAVYLLRGLAAKEQLYQPPHADIAYTLNHLASLYFDQGEYTRALPYAHRAWQQRRLIFGSGHIETIASQGNVARIHSASGNLDSAAIIYRNALEQFDHSTGDSQQYVGALTQALGNVYLRKKDYPQAETLYRRALAILDTQLPPEHPNRAFGLHALGKVLVVQRRYVEALPLLQQALDLRLRELDDSHPQVAVVQAALGQCLQGLGRVREANALLEQAQSTLGQQPEKYASELAEVAGLLAVPN